MRLAIALLFVIVALVLVPVLAVFSGWLQIDASLWAHLTSSLLPRLIWNTLLLLLFVAIGVIIIGVTLAWLVSHYDFPGRRWLEWALMLPMAMPAYVMAFVFLGLFDYTGPVQSGMRELGLGFLNIPDIRNFFFISLVMSSVLYPYVYLLARNAYLSQGRQYIEAAQSLGASRWRVIRTVHFGMARPAIVSGLALALMETLADFGTVAIFNYDTFTLAIYKAWFDYFDLRLACQLASVLLLLVAVTLLMESRSRGRKSYEGSQHEQQRKQLTGMQAWFATGACALVFLWCFVFPVTRLVIWALEDIAQLADPRFLGLVWRTFTLASIAAVCTASVALVLGLLQRYRPLGWIRQLLTVAKLGYALPGTVLAVGIVMPLGLLEQWWAPILKTMGIEGQLLLGSVVALLVAYLVRFLTVAIGPLETSLGRLSLHIPEAAKSLGANRWRRLTSIYLPLIRPGLLLALLLVFVDVMKEMPATLLMRPFGWDTLAVRIYEMTSEGEYQAAALPALCLLLVGLLPIIIAIRHTYRSKL